MRGVRRPSAAAATCVVLAVALLVALLPGVPAPFTASTQSSTTLTAGTLALSLDSSGTALFSVSGLRPVDDPVTRCLTVTNAGTVPLSRIGLHVSSTAGTGLGSALNLSIVHGTNTGSTTPSCSSMSYGGLVYAGTLSAAPTSAASDVADGAGVLAVGATRAYEIDLSLLDTPSAEGRTVTFGLTWTAS